MIKFDFRILKLYFQRNYLYLEMYYTGFMYRHISFMTTILTKCVYYNSSIYKILILFREKDLAFGITTSGVQDPEKSVRVLGIF